MGSEGDWGHANKLTMKAEFGLVMGGNQKKPMDEKVFRAVVEATKLFVRDLLRQREELPGDGDISVCRQSITTQRTTATVIGAHSPPHCHQICLQWL